MKDVIVVKNAAGASAKEDIMTLTNKELIACILVFSSMFMIIGGLFCLNAWSVYEEAKELMQSTVNLIVRDFSQEAKNEGTDTE